MNEFDVLSNDLAVLRLCELGDDGEAFRKGPGLEAWIRYLSRFEGLVLDRIKAMGRWRQRLLAEF